MGGVAIAAERGLPKGEDSPFVVRQIYEVKFGELHVTHPLNRKDPIRLILQTDTGLTCEMTQVEGGKHCLGLLLDAQNLSAQASGCSYQFHNQSRGCDFALKAEELKLENLFRALRTTRANRSQRRNI